MTTVEDGQIDTLSVRERADDDDFENRPRKLSEERKSDPVPEMDTYVRTSEWTRVRPDSRWPMSDWAKSVSL